jgi:hypothetical protein
MDPDLGAPASYLTCERGLPVYDARGERIGKVEHCLGDASVDVFDGVLVDLRPGPGGLRFADAVQVDRIYERGIKLTVGADALHDPEPAPGVVRVDPADAESSALADKLRRAWDYISGNY